MLAARRANDKTLVSESDPCSQWSKDDDDDDDDDDLYLRVRSIDLIPE